MLQLKDFEAISYRNVSTLKLTFSEDDVDRLSQWRWWRCQDYNQVNKEKERKRDWPVFELLEAVHATFPPELGNCRENLERTKNHRNKEIRQQICFCVVTWTHTVCLYFHPLHKQRWDQVLEGFFHVHLIPEWQVRKLEVHI